MYSREDTYMCTCIQYQTLLIQFILLWGQYGKTFSHANFSQYFVTQVRSPFFSLTLVLWPEASEAVYALPLSTVTC